MVLQFRSGRTFLCDWWIGVADFNSDSKLDVAVTDASANDVYILLGRGDGTFGPPGTIEVGNDSDAIVPGDFNHDEKLDLAIANFEEQ